MNFAETEGTGIKSRAETEGTGIKSMAETEGTGLRSMAETEGTGISRKTPIHFVLFMLVSLFSSALYAADLHLYSNDDHYVKGIYTTDGQTLFVEGLIDNYSVELITESTLITHYDEKATGEGTGGITYATGEGTGGNPATGEGTGGKPATGEGTGGAPATGEGTGGQPATGEGTGGLIEFVENNRASSSTINLRLNCESSLANGQAHTNKGSIDINNVQVFLNGQKMNCGITK